LPRCVSPFWKRITFDSEWETVRCATSQGFESTFCLPQTYNIMQANVTDSYYFSGGQYILISRNYWKVATNYWTSCFVWSQQSLSSPYHIPWIITTERPSRSATGPGRMPSAMRRNPTSEAVRGENPRQVFSICELNDGAPLFVPRHPLCLLKPPFRWALSVKTLQAFRTTSTYLKMHLRIYAIL
jgi:hypothetical protein